MSRKDLDSLLNKGKHYVCQYITAYCYDQQQQQQPQQSSSQSADDHNQPKLIEKHIDEHDHRRVLQIIDHLFDYRQTNYTTEEIIEWVKYLICGRRLPVNFAKDVKQYDKTSKCSLVWIDNFVAYRCRTCAISLCMSLCADCFQNGNHEGHDFNMFLSKSGGACDCGDSFVMKPEGFCRKHCQQQQQIDDNCSKQNQPPNSLLCIANEVIPRIIHYLLLYLRNLNFTVNKKANLIINEILIYLCDLGTLMQQIICQTLVDKNLYKSCNKLSKDDADLDYQYYLKQLNKNYQKILQEMELKAIFEDILLQNNGNENNNGDLNANNIEISKLSLINQINSFENELKHETYLDEIILWTIYYEFPTNLITFLLKMLPNDSYKQAFSEYFVKHYFRISLLIMHPIKKFANDKDIYYNKLANAILHISVQLFSNDNLAKDLCEKFHLLYIIIISLKFSICGTLVPSDNNQQQFIGTLKLNDELLDAYGLERSAKPIIKHRVINCDHPIFRYHRFWPLNSDLNNLFTHKKIARIFLEDHCLINEWLKLIMSFQSMNLIVLKSNKSFLTGENNEINNNINNLNYKNSFLAEVEISSSQMWTLISQLSDPNTLDLSENFIRIIEKWLSYWLESIGFDMKYLNANYCTFHLPLHRYYSVFLNNSIINQGGKLSGLLPDDQMKLRHFMAHPLQTLIVSYHIMSNKWSMNGPNIRAQALNYMLPHFCNSKIDADLFLVQQIAARIDLNEFIRLFFHLYGMNEHLNIINLPENLMEINTTTGSMDKNRLIVFLENGFTLFTIIVAMHLNLQMSSSQVVRKEMVALLSVSDKTHSQIQDMIPRRWGTLQNNNQFIQTLQEISEYKSPEAEFNGSLMQGYFYPNNNVWLNEYDPLFVLYRNAQRREFQSSLERFAAYAKQNGFYRSNSLPWPPFRIPAEISPSFLDPRTILNSKILHSYYFVILYRALNDNDGLITQHLLSIIVHLIELTLIESNKFNAFELTLEDFQLPNTRQIRLINEFDFENWYESDDILVNMMTSIDKCQLSNNDDDTIDGDNNNVNNVNRRKLMKSILNLLIEKELNLNNYFEENLIGLMIMIDDDDGGGRGNCDSNDLNDKSNLIQKILALNLIENYNYNDLVANILISEAKRLNRLIDPHKSTTAADDNNEAYIDLSTANDDIIMPSAAQAPGHVSEDFRDLTDSIIDDSHQMSNKPSTSFENCGQKPKKPRKSIRFQLNLNESILSLLLRLYSKLNERKDSFRTEHLRSDQLFRMENFDQHSNRIGDGTYFIGLLLKRFIWSCSRRLQSKYSLQMDESIEIVLNYIDDLRRTIWSNNSGSKTVNDSEAISNDELKLEDHNLIAEKDDKTLERIEKKRKAMERKKQIMNKFCLLQNEFLKNYEQNQGTSDRQDLADPSQSQEINTNASKSPEGSSNKQGTTDSELASKHDCSIKDMPSCSSGSGIDSANALGDLRNIDDNSTTSADDDDQAESYQCVICMDHGPSIDERPFVQMVLLQSSSILNNMLTYRLVDEFTMTNEAGTDLEMFMEQKYLTLPMTQDQYQQFGQRKIYGNVFDDKIRNLRSCFDPEAWTTSLNIGWSGGVHVQSCGHFMHIDCYRSYIKFVYRDRENLIEYPCPLCRKVSNSVLPVKPKNLARNFREKSLKQPESDISTNIELKILNLLTNNNNLVDKQPSNDLADDTAVDESNDMRFSKLISHSIEDLTEATESQYRNIGGGSVVESSCPQSLLLFLSSILRTNLEYNVLLWRRRLLPLTCKNFTCILPLFHALSLNASKLASPLYYHRLWSQIIGINIDSIDDNNGHGIATISQQQSLTCEKQVPLLLKDVSTVLLQLLIALPIDIDQECFLSIVRALFNVNFVQSILMLTCSLFTSDEKRLIRQRFENVSRNSSESQEFKGYLDYVGHLLKNFDMNSTNTTNVINNRKPLTSELLIETISKFCAPFLRLSSVIYHLLFNQSDLPNIHNLKVLDEFRALANYLHLNGPETSPESSNYDQSIDSVNDYLKNDTFLWPYLNWSTSTMATPSSLIDNWFGELNKLIQTDPIPSINLIQENLVFTMQPRLLRLPKVYEQLFMYYHKHQCDQCSQTPKEPSICLICGQLICIRESCCRHGSVYEGVYHSKKCGAGTALYLAVNSSAIILIRGRKACVWGSVYLDEFGEEDRDLKRGKPLYLCMERYNILEQQWLTHSFLNINKKLVYHKDLL